MNLLPCPFCGGEAKTTEHGRVSCGQCSAMGPYPGEADQWNRRKYVSRDSIIEECAKVAMDMPLSSDEERHDYRWSDTYKAAALEISNAIRALRHANVDKAK